MYIVDVQYFQILFLYSSFDHKSHIRKITLSVFVSVLRLENWHMYFIFEKGSFGCRVAIALCHFCQSVKN